MPIRSPEELLQPHQESPLWGNLGLWPAPSYEKACEQLASWHFHHLAPEPGERCLEVGMGYGGSLKLWREFKPGLLVGVEPRAPKAPGSPLELPFIKEPSLERAKAHAPYQKILIVDAFYHLPPPAQSLLALKNLLTPKGTLVFSSVFVAERLSPLTPFFLHLVRPLTNIHPHHFMTETDFAALAQRYFATVRIFDLTSEVLRGFAERYHDFPCRHLSGIKIRQTARLARHPHLRYGGVLCQASI